VHDIGDQADRNVTRQLPPARPFQRTATLGWRTPSASVPGPSRLSGRIPAKTSAALLSSYIRRRRSQARSAGRAGEPDELSSTIPTPHSPRSWDNRVAHATTNASTIPEPLAVSFINQIKPYAQTNQKTSIHHQHRYTQKKKQQQPNQILTTRCHSIDIREPSTAMAPKPPTHTPRSAPREADGAITPSNPT